MYSGHDTTVAPILHTLDIFNGIAPPYCSMIIFELFEQEGLQVNVIVFSYWNFTRSLWQVKISYKNTTETVFPLILPGCTELCPLEQFKGVLCISHKAIVEPTSISKLKFWLDRIILALTSKLRPTNVKEECGLSPASDPAIQRVNIIFHTPFVS